MRLLYLIGLPPSRKVKQKGPANLPKLLKSDDRKHGKSGCISLNKSVPLSMTRPTGGSPTNGGTTQRWGNRRLVYRTMKKLFVGYEMVKLPLVRSLNGNWKRALDN